ncbi:MAG: hypothetical protein ACI3W6_09605 [Clostridia bacterium]
MKCPEGNGVTEPDKASAAGACCHTKSETALRQTGNPGVAGKMKMPRDRGAFREGREFVWLAVRHGSILDRRAKRGTLSDFAL